MEITEIIFRATHVYGTQDSSCLLSEAQARQKVGPPYHRCSAFLSSKIEKMNQSKINPFLLPVF